MFDPIEPVCKAGQHIFVQRKLFASQVFIHLLVDELTSANNALLRFGLVKEKVRVIRVLLGIGKNEGVGLEHTILVADYNVDFESRKGWVAKRRFSRQEVFNHRLLV